MSVLVKIIGYFGSRDNADVNCLQAKSGSVRVYNQQVPSKQSPAAPDRRFFQRVGEAAGSRRVPSISCCWVSSLVSWPQLIFISSDLYLMSGL